MWRYQLGYPSHLLADVKNKKRLKDMPTTKN
jgi:hypothetical protein